MEMTYEEACHLIRPKRQTPLGHKGPTRQMVLYAELQDKIKSDRYKELLERIKSYDTLKEYFVLEKAGSKIECVSID